VSGAAPSTGPKPSTASALTYLRMTGKEAYTAERYIAACELIQGGEVVTRSANKPPAGPLGPDPDLSHRLRVRTSSIAVSL
jgi:hypothetical protein